MNEEKLYDLVFLVSASSWKDVVKIFKDDLGIERSKQDNGAQEMPNHYIVKISFKNKELTDLFYKSVNDSENITILQDNSSEDRADEALRLIKLIEIQLRELLIYAHNIVDAYFDITKPKSSIGKTLAKSEKLLDKNMIDPMVAFLDLGEIIDILGKNGNKVETASLSDDIVKLLESSDDYLSFKKQFVCQFKRLTVWDMISKAVLKNATDWSDVKIDLDRLKDIRNAAAHFRVLPPCDLYDTKKIVTALIKTLEKKSRPNKTAVSDMYKTFDQWSKALYGLNEVNEMINALKIVNPVVVSQIEQTQESAKLISKMINSELRALDMSAPKSAIETLRTYMNQANSLGLKSCNHDIEKPVINAKEGVSGQSIDKYEEARK